MFLWILLLAPGSLGAESKDQVSQPHRLEFTEGGRVEIPCNFSITNYGLLVWYQQLPGRAPDGIISAYRSGKDAEHYAMTFETANRSMSLIIKAVSVGEAGMYHCAVGDQDNFRFFFGSGTKLTVLPNIKNSAPSAYVLKPAAGSEDQVGTACLVTDFSPAGNVTVYLNETEKGVRPATLVESEKKWSYGIVEWSPKKQDDQFKCRAEYKGQTIEAQEWKEDTQKSCSVISVSEYFETDEKLNTLSLTVLGLKIVFMKSIAFNLLMTLRLWTS